MSTKITLGFSSCPNDTFIFDAMIHHKIDTEELEFECIITDVEELNKMAFEQKLMVTKISFNAFSKLSNDYILLDAGAALGRNCGPLIVAKEHFKLSELANKHVALPGFNTTANLLLSIAFPEINRKSSFLFSDIEDAILNQKVDAGLIIHESRFTYEQKGLKKIIDLGEYWEDFSHNPIPLGGIIANRRLGESLLHKINRVLKRSVAFAMENPTSGKEFIRCHAQEMSEEVMYKHIELYVNHFSLDLGTEGKKAIETLFEKAYERGLIPLYHPKLFLE